MGFSFSFRDIYVYYYEKQLAQVAERQMYFCRLWVRVPCCFFSLYQINAKGVEQVKQFWHRSASTILTCLGGVGVLNGRSYIDS